MSHRTPRRPLLPGGPERRTLLSSLALLVGATALAGAPLAPGLSAQEGGAATDAAESVEDIGPPGVGVDDVRLPVDGDAEGPSVLAVQILLDQNQFSPGVIDGVWGRNTARAAYWFRETRGLEAEEAVDRATLETLSEGAGGRPLVMEHTLTAEDVEGPFRDLPEDIYARAEMSCTCYESLAEKLGERFHATPELLRRLNPDVELNALSEGDRLRVPDVGNEPEDPGATPVARIVVSDPGHYVHAEDEGGEILYHFPAVLGADYAPSPSGNHSVTSIAWDPTWHYKPDLLSRVDPSREDAIIPPGPNNAVGVVWMQLSIEHYGIHGTGAPSTVGYADSHGCVRLTNWDATFLGHRIEEGVPVVFRETTRRTVQ